MQQRVHRFSLSPGCVFALRHVSQSINHFCRHHSAVQLRQPFSDRRPVAMSTTSDVLPSAADACFRQRNLHRRSGLSHIHNSCPTQTRHHHAAVNGLGRFQYPQKAGKQTEVHGRTDAVWLQRPAATRTA